MKPITAVVLSLLLAGCATMKSIPTLTERDNGRDIHIAVGERLIVKLASNATTGYRWAAPPPAEPVLRQLDEATYVPNMAPPGMVGVGGTETFEFKALKAGQETLQIQYARSWEKDVAPARVFSLNVTVTQ